MSVTGSIKEEVLSPEVIVHKEKKSKKRKRVEYDSDDDIKEVIDEVQPEQSSSEKVPKKKRTKLAENEEAHESQEVDCGKASEPKTYRKIVRGFHRLNSMDVMTYEEAKELMKSKPKSCLVAVAEKRHATMPLHLVGGNITPAVEYMTKQTIGKYRAKVDGIVIAIGSTKLMDLPRVIDDQCVVHINYRVNQIIFRPKPSARFLATVTHIGDGFMSALVHGAITMTTTLNQDSEKRLKGLTLEIDDTVEVSYKGLRVSRGIAQLKGDFLKIVSKGDPLNRVKKEDAEEETANVKVKQNVKTSFVDSDDE